MKLKYVTVSNGRNYLYQRRFPKRLLAHPQIKGPIYKRSMGVSVGSPDEDILAAHKFAHSTYENFVSVLALVNLDQLSQAEKIKKAQSLIDVAGLKAGMLADDPQLGPQQQQALREDAWNHIEYTDIFPGLGNPDLRPKQGEPLSPKQEIEDIAFKLLAEPAGAKGRTSMPMLSDCWEPYRELKGIDIATVEGARKLSQWQQFLEFAGDDIMTTDAVQDGVELYVEKLFKTGVKATTVTTRLQKNLAIVRHSIKQRRLPIVVYKPEIKGGKDYADDYCLNAQEEQALMALLGTMKPSWQTAALALMLETGCYASELQRLEEFNVHLDDPIPHILLKNKQMKTKARARVLTPVCPTTLRLLKSQMFNRRWTNFQKTNGSNTSRSLRSIIQQIAPLATARSLRHGTRLRLMASGIPFDLQALIGGWSAGLNTVQMGYGRAGVTDQRTLTTLQAALRTANGNMEAQGPSNVIQLREGP